ncbi:MAG: PP2C family protein-serine/threonine phosphatase [Cellvibrionaceae bacterium]
MTHRSLLQHIDSGQVDLRQLKASNTFSTKADSCGGTHKGWIRFINEDAYLELPNEKLWVVADGMGGHKRGDYASKAIIKALQSFSRKEGQSKNSLLSLIESLQNRLTEANETCQKAFRARRVGSTVTLLFEFGGYCFFLWAGDSRIYRLRNGNLEQMTRDHSLAQEKYDKGELNQDEAKSHPSAHILTRAVGVNRHLKLELRCSPVMSGDRYLLCSDGLHAGVSKEEILSNLSLNTQQNALDTLITAALDSGGRDNITVIIVDFDA